jgi:FlaA1/EpsC-like NDP-sugar epimerase
MIKIFPQNKKFNSLRIFIILLNDVILINISLYFSYFLRIEFLISPKNITDVAIFSTLIYLILFLIFRIDKHYFRYFNFNSYKLYFKLFFLFTCLFSLYVFIQSSSFIPRSLVAIFPSFFFGILILSRILFVKFSTHYFKIEKNNTILFGLDRISIATLSSHFKILYIIDNNKNNSQRVINGIRIISPKEFLFKYKSLNFNQILILNEKNFDVIKGLIRDHIIENKILVQKINIKNNELSTKPYFNFNYFFNRKSKINSLVNFYNQKNILVTGAGGSIGSSIVSQLLNTQFSKLILLDNSEYSLYTLTNKINDPRIVFILHNFNDEDYMTALFKKYKIDCIFHAAAYKHVPLTEINPLSAIKNNFIDTHHLIKNVVLNQISYFCLISSDKAVRPTNIMGASKRLAELSLIYFSKYKFNKSTILNSVRFGNVINSSGSVLPLFQNQIKNNGPLTLTHKDITRYFMTIEEAANLVLNVYKIAKGGEVFLLDMGKPIKLIDLAKLIIQFSGKTIKRKEKGDIQIKIVGLRKGEKLYEELLVNKKSKKTNINSIFESVEEQMTQSEYKYLYNEIISSFKNNDNRKLYKLLKNKFIEYKINNA